MATLSETIGGFPIKAHLGRRSVDVVHYSVNKSGAVRMAIEKMLEGTKGTKGAEGKEGEEKEKEEKEEPVEDNANGLIGEEEEEEEEDDKDDEDEEGLATVLCMLTGHESTDEELFAMLSERYSCGKRCFCLGRCDDVVIGTSTLFIIF